MEKTLKIIAAFLLLIAAIMAVLVISNVISLHEIPVTLAELFRNDKAETSSEGTDPHVKVDDVENVLKGIADAINKVANTQEAMTQLTVNLDTSNETFHKELIALLESKGLHCCCCKCTGEQVTETQAPVVTECSHSNTTYSIGNGVHYTKCASCGKVLATANCKFNSNGYCYTCGGYRKPAETTAPETTAPACTHATTCVRGNGVHSNVCTKCGLTVSTVNCTYTSGKCVCGNECVHSTEVKAGGNGVHSNVCTKCGLTVSTVNCTYTSGKCVCGNECAHTTQLVPNTNDTHSAKCTKCNVVVFQEKCTFDVIYGKCSCGNTEGVIEYGHHTIYVGTDDDEQIIKPNPGSNVIKPNNSDDEQIIKPNPGSNVIKPNNSDDEQIIKPNPGSNVIKPNSSNNDEDYTCTDPIRPDGGQIIIKPNPGSGSNIIAPNPTN